MNRFINTVADMIDSAEKYFSPSTEELDSEMQLGLEFVRKLAAGKPTAFVPQVMILGCMKLKEPTEGDVDYDQDARSVFVIGSDFNEREAKNKTMHLIGNQCVSKGNMLPKIAVLISEAWNSKDISCMPSEAQDRTECIVLMGKTMMNKSLFYGIPVLRDSENRIYLALDEMTRHEGGESSLLDSFFRGALEAIAERKKASEQ